MKLPIIFTYLVVSIVLLNIVKCDDLLSAVERINKVQSEKIETFKRVNEVLNTLKCKLRKISGYDQVFSKSSVRNIFKDNKEYNELQIKTRKDYTDTLTQIKEFLKEFEEKHLPKLIVEVGHYNILKNEPEQISKMTTIPAEQVYNYGRGITIVFDNARASIKYFSRGKIDIPANICDNN